MTGRGLVLVTGASGRIARAVAPWLDSRGWRLRLTDRTAAPEAAAGPFVQADITDADDVAGLCDGVDAVVHLAGHPNTRDWDEAERLNVRGTRLVLEAAAAAGVRRFIYASSIHVFGMHAADTPFVDDLEYRPDSAYGWSKAVSELLLRHWCDRYGMAGFALRICSFRLEPTNARELRTWLSHPDMCRLATACLETGATGFIPLWGVSANRRASIDRANWDRIGYAPEDDAGAFEPTLRARGVDTTIASEWPLLAAHFADWERV